MPSPFVTDRILTFRELKREYIRWILRITGNNKTEAARLLGIDRSSFHRILRQRRKAVCNTSTAPAATAESSESYPPTGSNSESTEGKNSD
jgi:predicted DNA-binding protein (UPF0251 family)